MLSGYVVPIEPVCHVFGKLGASFINVQVDPFILQRSPEPFDEDVIPETPFTVHADFNAPGFEHGRESSGDSIFNGWELERFSDLFIRG